MAKRRQSSQQSLLLAVPVLIVIVLAVTYFQSQNKVPSLPGPTPPGTSLPAASPQMLLGNPSTATADASNKNNYLMVKPYYALAYNDSAGTPIWVSWQVTQADLGTAPRKQTFDPDLALPPGFFRVNHKDYSGSGFDRGHMCPHSDRAANEEMSFATFVMTNIIPQAPNVNRKAWAQLEDYGRELVRQHQRLYITAGPQGKGGRGSNGIKETIASGTVTVPAACWKIIVIVPDAGGDDDMAKINSHTRVIAVMMPNDNEKVGEAWAGFRTSTAEIERQTGLKFFDRLPAEVAASLRTEIDSTNITPPRALGHGE